jgi:hypothetical membrane protein
MAQKAFALSGIAGPILFTILVIVEGLLRPGYSQVAQVISELGQVGTPNAILQDANFVATGLLLIAFAVGLYRGIGRGRFVTLGIALFLVFPGVMVLVGTLFPLPDPVHTPLSIAGFIVLIVAVFVVSFGLRKDDRWKRLASYSLGTGVVLVGLLLLIIATGQGVLAPYFGLLQRLFIVPVFLWIEVLAIRLLALSSRPTQGPQPQAAA